MASENLGENGRVRRRLGVILLYKLVIGMLRTNAEFIEMLTGFAFWQDLKTPCLSNTNCSEAFPHLKLCPWKARNTKAAFHGATPVATPMAKIAGIHGNPHHIQGSRHKTASCTRSSASGCSFPPAERVPCTGDLMARVARP